MPPLDEMKDESAIAAMSAHNASDDSDDVRQEPKAPAPKRRGKKAAKQEQKEEAKVALETLPPEMIEILAIAPILLASAAVKQMTVEKDAQGNVVIEGIQLRCSEDALAACGPAFKTWLASMNIELTPGWALVACYTLALASAVPDAMGQIAARAEAKQPKEIPQNVAKPESPSNDSPGSQQADSAQAK